MSDTVLLTTALGTLRGIKTDRCRIFLGVPFGTAGRFRYAGPPAPWKGERDATVPGPACPQNRALHEHLEHPTRRFYAREFRDGFEAVYDEDCLNLNIYAPLEGKNCPVLLFFYGGGFDSGLNSEPPFDGSGLAGRGVVAVFANYRVGPLGYLTSPELKSENWRDGNFGLDDQYLALRWVRDHIADFGGDPENVTLAGQSAGAISVQLLCLNPANEGLFRRALMMSGAGQFPKFACPRPAADTHAYWQEFMEIAGCRSLSELRALPLEKLFDAVEILKSRRKDNLYNTMPVVDGVLVPKPVPELMKSPLPVDYMVGITSADMYAPFLAAIGVRFARQVGGYLYYFDLEAPGDDNRAFHSCDVRYLFETLSGSWRPYDDRDREAARQLADYAANFARAGDPNGPGLPRWEKAGKGKPALRFAETGTAMGRPRYGKLTANFLRRGDPRA